MVVLFSAAVQIVVGVCLDAKALVCSQEEMLVNWGDGGKVMVK